MFKFKLYKRDKETLLDWIEEPNLVEQIQSKTFKSKDYVSASTKNIKAIVGRDELITIIKRTKDLENYNIISISDPYQKDFNEEDLKINCNNLLQLEFTDMRENLSEDEIKNRKDIEPISFDQIKIIKKFILDNKDKPFIINCDEGISRSAAISIYLENLLNNKEGIKEIKSHYRYSPNKLILDKIREFHNISKELQYNKTIEFN